MTRIEIQSLINKHTQFTSMLNELIKSLLSSSEIKYHIIECRTKSIESIEEKIIRKDIRKVEEEITDVSGIRIILYYQDDVDKIIDIIKENFSIDEKNSMNKADLYHSNEFGYLSTHYIISLNSKRSKLPEWKPYAKLKAEVQIRTVLQHSWASISHELSYKKDYEIPKELQRKLFRLAGLFELADEQFLEIRDEHELLKQSIEKISKTADIETERINLLTLKYSIQKKNKVYENITSIALKAGFEGSTDDFGDDSISEIIRISDLLGLKQIQEIETLLENKLKEIELFFYTLFNENVSDAWLGDKPFYILLALISQLDKKQLQEFFYKSDWNEDIVNLIVGSIGQTKDL